MKIMHVFLDADLRNGHNGFDAVLKKQEIKIADFELGESVLFVNTAQTKAKAYGPHGYLGYVKFNGKMTRAGLDIFTASAVPGKTTTMNKKALMQLRGVLSAVESQLHA